MIMIVSIKTVVYADARYVSCNGHLLWGQFFFAVCMLLIQSVVAARGNIGRAPERS